jgi:hypothetical protein
MLSLAQTRDLTALAHAARAAAKRQGKKDARALLAAAESLEAERDALPRLDTEAVRAGITDLLALAQVWPVPSARQIRKGARRVARRARAAFDDGRRETAGSRHEWRKREKDRFFAATLLDDAWPVKSRRRCGEQLGDVLGMERDAALLSKRIDAAPALAGNPKAAKRAQRVLKRRMARLGKRADGLGRKLHAGGA